MKQGTKLAAVGLSLILTLTACAPAGEGNQTPATSPSPSESAPVSSQPLVAPPEGCVYAQPNGDGVYDLWEGITLDIPEDMADRVLVFSPQAGGSLQVYEKESYQQSMEDSGYEAGFLFGLGRADRVGYEQDYLRCNGGSSGLVYFARDDTYYYGWGEATYVQFYRSGSDAITENLDWGDWVALLSRGLLGREEEMQADFIARNDLEPYDSLSDLSRDFFWESAHVYVNYHNADWTRSDTLTLSQPAGQGEGGVWCVEQQHDNNYGHRYWVLPATELTLADYYAQVQTQVDGGAFPELLDPLEAALTWLREDYGDPDISPEDLRLLEGEPGGNVWRRISPILPQNCTLESGLYEKGVFTPAGDNEQPEYFGRPDQNLTLGSVASPSLFPLVWVKGEPVDTSDGVRVTAENGDTLLFLAEGDLLRVERDGVIEWFAPAYGYQPGPYAKMHAICQSWASYEPS